ncbi:hypothetical protein HZS_1208, partial [Henneguya salminicola]
MLTKPPFLLFFISIAFDTLYHREKYKGNTIKPFYYKVISNLSSNIVELETKLSEQYLSKNYDAPKATLEGLLQTVVCDSIGWDHKQEVLKTVVVITNSRTKSAGDGKIFSIIEPNDGACHVDETGNYEDGMRWDYPSVSLVGEALAKNKINVIFAVKQEALYEYQNMVSSWAGINTEVIELENDPSKILKTINYYRKKFNSRFQLHYKSNKNIKTTIYVYCPKTYKNFSSECNFVNEGDVVTFEVQLTIVESNTKENTIIIFSVSTFGTVEVEIQEINDCFCSRNNINELSLFCNKNGFLTCGICNCLPNWRGEHCEFNSTADEGWNDCTNKDTQEICSNVGKCEFGICKCPEKKNEKFSGPYCECDSNKCPLFESKVCGGI